VPVADPVKLFGKRMGMESGRKILLLDPPVPRAYG